MVEFPEVSCTAGGPPESTIFAVRGGVVGMRSRPVPVFLIDDHWPSAVARTNSLPPTPPVPQWAWAWLAFLTGAGRSARPSAQRKDRLCPHVSCLGQTPPLLRLPGARVPTDHYRSSAGTGYANTRPWPSPGTLAAAYPEELSTALRKNGMYALRGSQRLVERSSSMALASTSDSPCQSRARPE